MTTYHISKNSFVLTNNIRFPVWVRGRELPNKMHDLRVMIHRDLNDWHWVISEVTTGASIAQGNTQAQAMANAEKDLERWERLGWIKEAIESHPKVST